MNRFVPQKHSAFVPLGIIQQRNHSNLHESRTQHRLLSTSSKRRTFWKRYTWWDGLSEAGYEITDALWLWCLIIPKSRHRSLHALSRSPTETLRGKLSRLRLCCVVFFHTPPLHAWNLTTVCSTHDRPLLVPRDCGQSYVTWVVTVQWRNKRRRNGKASRHNADTCTTKLYQSY